jgi:hypothetical protein
VNHRDEHSDTASALRAYFKDLDAALSQLPRGRREQLIGEIRQHVTERLAEQPPQSPAELRNQLDRVGRPEDIAAAALEEEPERRRRLPTGQRVLIGGIGVLVLVGLGTGLTVVLSSPTSSRPSDAGSRPAARRSATAPTTPRATVSYTTTVTAPAPATPVGTTAPTGAPTSAPTGGTTALRAVLAPATVPPVSNECTLQLTYDTDGNVSPLVCPDGGVNGLAWHVYAYGSSSVLDSSELLRLGPYASPAQVYEAMCHDYTNVYKTRPITESAEQLAQTYYGWRFAGDNPLQDFQVRGCPP